MPTLSSKLVRNGLKDSSKDYADLFEEMGVQPNAQEQVFSIIRQFRDKPNNLARIRVSSDSSHRYVNNYFFGKNNMREFADVQGLSGPFRDVFDNDKRKYALPSLTRVVNKLWLRMRDIIFEDSTTGVYLEKKRAQNTNKQPQRSSRKRTSSTLSSMSSTVDLTEQRPPPSRPTAFSPNVPEAEIYNAETIRLLDAVLDPSLSHSRTAPVRTAPTIGRRDSLTTTPRRSARFEGHAQSTNTAPTKTLLNTNPEPNATSTSPDVAARRVAHHDRLANPPATTTTPRQSAQFNVHAQTVDVEPGNAEPVHAEPTNTEPANILPTNPNLITANGSSGMDRAWQLVQEMMGKRRADSNGGDRGEFLLFYSGK